MVDSSVRNLVRRLAVDVTPLRQHRDFRLLWFGELVSETGSQVTLVALYIQVYALTRSAAAVGVIGLVQLLGLVAATFLAGPLIDTHDRRQLLVISQLGQAGASAMLLAGALAGHPPLAVVYVAAGLVAAFGGFSLANRSAMTPNLVPHDQLPTALALNQVMWNTCAIVGPAIGGLLVAAAGLSWAYAADVASFTATIGAGLLMHSMPPVRSRETETVEDAAPAASWRQLTEGFRYLRGRRVLQSTFVVDLVAMIFGMPRVLFPVLAVTQFHQGAAVVGALFSAVAVGALIGALTTGWIRQVRRQGLAVLVSVAVWGAGIVAFGVVGDHLVLALLCLAVAGGADVISAVFRSTILQTTVPDDLRGRLSSVHILVVAGGPRLGDFEAGLVAAAFTPLVSVVSGGALCIVGVVILALRVPEFRHYLAPTAPASDGAVDGSPPAR